MKQQQMISMLTRALEGGIQVVGASMHQWKMHGVALVV